MSPGRGFRALLISKSLYLVLLTAGGTPTPTGQGLRGEAEPAREVAVSGKLAEAPERPPLDAAGVSLPAPTDDRREFSTRNAHFLPAQWDQLPGWRDDDVSDAWLAFLQSCAALNRKAAWEGPCERTRHVAKSKEAVRTFFEREFAVYEIRNADRTPDGVITGYYEPLLMGSRTRQGSFVYPVYGQPADMLVLDIRLWPKALRGRAVGARIQGRSVIPVLEGNAPYVLDVGNLAPDDRDKKLRLRQDGQRVVPYFTRAEIERNGLPNAPVLAWVDNPAALYSMQIQGSGKIRFLDGGMVRLAYADQNGYPFRPPVGAASIGQADRITTRGSSIQLPGLEDNEAAEGPDSAEGPTRGILASALGKSTDAQVENMIERLSGGQNAASRPAKPSVAPPQHSKNAELTVISRDAAHEEPMTFAPASPLTLAAISSDPSFVFFREIPDGPGGPIGSLGVPLTAGRSVAVDPRSTPLGNPVFLSTTRLGDNVRLNRLVMAQDTGGAIRGAVRADYFMGFGSDAYAQAARMKDIGRMWLLIPIGQQIAARDNAILARGRFDVTSAPECVVEDSESCVEDR